MEHFFHSRAICSFQTVNLFRMRNAWLLISEKPLHQRQIQALTSAKARRSCTLRTPSCLTTFLAPSATAASILRWCLSSSTRSSSGQIVSEGRPAQKPAFSKKKNTIPSVLLMSELWCLAKDWAQYTICKTITSQLAWKPVPFFIIILRICYESLKGNVIFGIPPDSFC